MLRTITVILVFMTIMQPVAASDLLFYIRPGTLENQTKGFVLMYPLEDTIEPGQNVTFKNEDLHRRPFTLVSEEDMFPPITLTFRRSLSVQFDDPGIYKFYLEEKPTVTVQLTVADNNSGNGPQATQSPSREQEVVRGKNPWAAIKELPGFVLSAALIIIILTVLIIRKKKRTD